MTILKVARKVWERAKSYTNAINGGKASDRIENRLLEMCKPLPKTQAPVANYVSVKVFGLGKKYARIAGQIPLFEGKLIYKGKVGKELTLEEAIKAAELCTLNGLAALKSGIGTLENVLQFIKVEVMVNSAPGFTDQPKVANGVSDLLVKAFGEKGKHTRTAVGANELPLDAAVEVAFTVELVGPIGRALSKSSWPI